LGQSTGFFLLFYGHKKGYAKLKMWLNGVLIAELKFLLVMFFQLRIGGDQKEKFLI